MKKLTPLALAASLLLLALGLGGTRDGVAKRYLSPPLPDGSRYTFVYPQTMKVRWSDTAGCFLQEDGQSPSAIARLRAPLPGRRNKNQLLIERDEIRVSVAQQNPPYENSRANVVGARVQYLSIQDVRSRTYFFVQHNGYRSNPHDFRGTSATLNESFRILKPGENAPR